MAASDLASPLDGLSLRDVRATSPLQDVTTTSVNALKAFSEGNRTTAFEDQHDALPYYTRAIALDSTFAVAYMRIARILAKAQPCRGGFPALIFIPVV